MRLTPVRFAAAARLRALSGCLLALFAAAEAHAHRTNLSTSAVEVRGAAVAYRLTVSAHDLAVAVGIETDLIAPVPRPSFEERQAAIDTYIRTRLAIAANDEACPLGRLTSDYDRLPEAIVFTLAFACPAPVERLTITYDVFFDVDPEHRGIGGVDWGTGAEEFVVEPLINRIEVEIAGPPRPKPFLERALRFTVLGVEHIAGGIDHVLFLIALLIVSARFLHLITVVTAFTLAHSVTLSLAWFGFIDLPARLTESLIALSIAYVAAENVWGKRFGHRWMLAGGFGLVHGLGFYGILRELDLGGGALTPLFAFNLGVEIGQVAILALFFPALVLVFRRPWYRSAMRAGSLAILALAGFWFVQRAFLV